LTKFEKDKERREELRAIRKRLNWTQPQYAHALNLNPTYVSQLESGSRPLQNWVLVRAREVEISELEKSKNVEGGYVVHDAPHSLSELRHQCHAHLERVLEQCQGDQNLLIWTLVELQRHFPLRPPAGPPRKPSSISVSEEDKRIISAAEDDVDRERRPPQPSPPAHVPSAGTSEPSDNTSGESKGPRPSPQARALK
jgi:DNA-binding XRE family transcriptional regulator